MLWTFEYAPGWLESDNSHPLSLHIPLQETKLIDGSRYRPFQWFFDNLLPEEKDSELLAKDVKVPLGDAFALLTEAGAESARAITLLPEGENLATGTVHELSNEELKQRYLY